MAETTEHEAIEAFRDGLKESASCVIELEHPERHPFAPMKFMKAIDRASGSAHQLGHMQVNPDFFRIRDMLELLKNQIAAMAIGRKLGRFTMPIEGGNPFVVLSEKLKSVCIMGERIATSKAVTKAVVSDSLDLRQSYLKQGGI